MESTMRYLKPNRSQAVREKVNEIFWLRGRLPFEIETPIKLDEFVRSVGMSEEAFEHVQDHLEGRFSPQ
jgi:hypothetical protein